MATIVNKASFDHLSGGRGSPFIGQEVDAP
jgi:hypothetical protein